MSKIFINRPIFAIVIAIMITLIGLLAAASLPIARYPQISPPQVNVRAMYPGANAEVVSDTVASVIEEQVMGVDSMDYMSSISGSDGSYSLQVLFKQGSDPDLDTVNVQNRVARAVASLPQDVQKIGVTTTKSSSGMDFVFTLRSPNGTYDGTFLKNYGSQYVLPEIKTISGVGSVMEFGSDYAMRIWLNPQKMSQYSVTTQDILQAINSQNLQAPVGSVGKPPIDNIVQKEYILAVKGRLNTPEDFGNIAIRKDARGNIVYIKDVARVELGSNSYAAFAESYGKPVAGFAISLTPDANALDTIGEIKKVLERDAKTFPEDLTYSVVVDNTNFVKASVKEVLHTFLEALILVGIIVYIFLQNWRSTVIPMIAVPVSLLGTFAVFVPLGFTINTLTLFAMVLAIGLVVDDAIVVIEAVEYEMKYNGKSPKEATIIAMENVQGPVVAVALVLSSVFVPVAFMGGITGVLYKQFALTIAISVMISAFVALTLTPALCALMLKPHQEIEGENESFITRMLHKFNYTLDKFIEWYGDKLLALSNHLKIVVGILLLFVIIAGGVFKVMPRTFVPSEDNGFFMIAANLPPGSTLEQSSAVVSKLEKFLEQNKVVDNMMGVAGFDLLSSSQKSSGAFMFARLLPWDQRTGKGQDIGTQIKQTFGFAMQNIPEATVIAMNPPSIPGLGNNGGLSMYLLNKAGDSVEDMVKVSNDFLANVRKNPMFSSAFTGFDNNTPAYNYEINREKVARDGVPLTSIYNGLQGIFSQIQVNDFTAFGQNFKVMVQGEPSFRTNDQMINYIYVRNGQGQLVPVSNYITPKASTIAATLTRFNNYPAISYNITVAPGVSSGDAIKALEEIAQATVPQGYSVDWAGQAREEIRSGSQTIFILGLGFIFVFLILAALYESWKVPFSVLLSVPTGLLGAATIPYILGLPNSIYVQIGLLTLVGLAAKNAILIVEYAKVRVDKRGMGLVEAAVEASKIRLRPILMTSFAFILGTLPLALSSGAGAASRVSMGMTVVAGMTTATIFGLMAIPMLFIIVEKIGFKKK